MTEQEQSSLPELQDILPAFLLLEFQERNGAAHLAEKLPRIFAPESVTNEQSDEARCWDYVGMHYFQQNRFYEALPLFNGLYDHMLTAQETMGRVHKGTPLARIAECYRRLGFRSMAKRYWMLTLCEDAVSSKGVVDPNLTGSYFRLVWQLGLPHTQFLSYATKMFNLSVEHPTECLFPEWILQQLDKDWMTELPEIQESLHYRVNQTYIRHLLAQLGSGTGKALEMLADYLLSCIPGCRTARSARSHSTDYDIVCSIDGTDVDFRSELGRYFVCECKDWSKAVDFTTIAKFCRVLDSIKARFGILFSKNGISGKGRAINAERELIKVFQDRGMVIVVIDQNDIEKIATGDNFTTILRVKFEQVRLDLIGK